MDISRVLNCTTGHVTKDEADTLQGMRELIRAQHVARGYAVIVGNLGTVHTGTNKREALREFREWCEAAESYHGRASGETVTLLQDGEPLQEREALTFCDLLSVEAWRDGYSGWTWNNWHKVARVPLAWCELKPRALLRKLRERGDLAHGARFSVDDDGYNVVICKRSDGEPLLALAYGAEQ